MKISGLIPLVAGQSCWQEDAAIVGSPLEIVKAVNADDCFSACYDHHLCNSIAFKNGECHLAAEVTFTAEKGTLAALRSCFEKPERKQLRHHRRSKCKRDDRRFRRFNHCMVRHSRVEGRFIGKACTKHAASCAELCHTTKGCLHFTFERRPWGPFDTSGSDPWWNHPSGISRSDPWSNHPFHTSGSDPWSNHPFGISGSNPWGKMRGAGHCRVGSRCLLMSEAKKQVRSPGHTSGSMRCFYPKEHSSDHHHHADKDCECGMSECLKSGVIYLGHTQKRTVATCAVDCALDCVRARVCKHFVFYEKKSECVHLGKVFGSLSDADAVSGDISCLFPDIHVLPPTTSTPTTLPSTSIVFQTTPSPTTSTPTTLPPTSIAVPTTPAQTTPNSTNELYTSSAASTSNSLYHDRTTKEDYGSPCYQRNTLLEGPTMASLVTSTVARCHQLCFTRPFCEKFSWRWDTKACELKTIATGKTFSETTVSGEMSCFHPEMYTTSPAPSTTTATHTSGFAERCFEKGVRYEGEALLSSDQETLYECADLCLADNYCEVITFFNGRCDLFVSASKAPCPECISAKWTCLQGEVY